MGVALKGFKESLKLASALKTIEREKFLKAKVKDRPSVMGLRGGAAVLMVAAFEYYLRTLFEIYISKLNTNPPSIDISKLPDKLKVKIVFDSLTQSMKGSKYGAKKEKVDRINDITTACKYLICDHVDPATFTETNSNPNSATVKAKFKEIGIEDVYALIKSDFEKKWGSRVAIRFVEDKLNEIVQIRHVVAHTTDTLKITKKTQNESLKFLTILAELLEKVIEKQIKNLLKIGKK